MKRIIALLLTCFICAACFSVFASADDYDVAASLMPDPNGDMTADGCTVTENDDGSVTITLTAAKAKVTMVYKDGDTVNDEKYSTFANYPYFAYWFEDSGVTKFDARAYYQRKDKVADLYISGMRNNPEYYAKGDKDAKCAVWNFYKYVEKKGADYVTGDYAVIKFDKIEYEIEGKVGDTVTIYYHGTMSKDIPEDFGTKATETPSEDESTVVSDEPSTAASEEPSTAASEPETSAPAATENKNIATSATVVGETPSYVVTEGQWPSDYSGKINDGVIGEYGKYGNKWAAFYHNNSEKDNFDGKVGEIVLDFGEKKDFTSFRTNIWGGQPKGDGIASMEKVEFFVSDDNKTWTSVGAVTEGLEVEGAWVEVKKAASGRYVKYAYTKSTAEGKGGSFLFISECEAYAKVASSSDTSTATSDKPAVPTSDNGVVAIAIVSVLAAAGVVIVKKSR